MNLFFPTQSQTHTARMHAEPLRTPTLKHRETETRRNFRHANEKGQNANANFIPLCFLIILSGSKRLHQKGAAVTKEGLSSQISSICVSF